MITFSDVKIKMQRETRDTTLNTLVQLAADYNTGYQLFAAKLSRYYTRKQQFTDLKAQQGIYQTPIDAIRLLGMTVQVTANFQPPVKEVKSETEWRQITSWQTASNWPAWYFSIGNDEISLWPLPSQNVTKGLRYYYQPKVFDLTIDDSTSTSLSATATVVKGSATVTLSSAVLSSDMTSLHFQVTGLVDTTDYEIVASTSSTLTLKSAYIGSSAAGLSWRIGQVIIIPTEYVDAPLHYALGNYWSSKGNEGRSAFHLGTKEKPGMFYSMMEDCKEAYASSNVSGVITEDEIAANPFFFPAVPGSS